MEKNYQPKEILNLLEKYTFVTTFMFRQILVVKLFGRKDQNL